MIDPTELDKVLYEALKRYFLFWTAVFGVGMVLIALATLIISLLRGHSQVLSPWDFVDR